MSARYPELEIDWEAVDSKHGGDRWVVRQKHPDGGGYGHFASGLEEHEARMISASPELLSAAELMIPANLCLTNRNIPDETVLPLDVTMGDLRKVAAAIAKAKGK